MKAKVFATLIVLYLFGTGTAGFFELTKTSLVVMMIALILAGIFSLRIAKISIGLFAIFFLLLGFYTYQEQLNHYQKLNKDIADKKLDFEAIVDEIPVKKEHGYMSKVIILSTNEQINSSRLIAYFPENQKPDYNQKIKFSGKIKPFKDEKTGYLVKEKVIGEVSVFDYEILGKSEKITIKFFLYNLRQNFNQSIARSLPTDEANLASGLILGEKANFNSETKRNLQAAGITHIIALSGYNITIILSLLKIIERKVSRMTNLLLPLALIIFFVILTGASASIVRAGIMGFMPVLAQFLFRPKNSFLAVLFSAFVMVFINPFILLHDVGFQLSFVALLGLMYISPIFASWFKREGTLVALLSETLGAQLAVLPLLIYYFESVSVISPISNMIILLLVPLGMFVSFVTGLAGLMFEWLGHLVAIPSYFVLKFINLCIEVFGQLPFSLIQFKLTTPWWLVVMYLVLSTFILFAKRAKPANLVG